MTGPLPEPEFAPTTGLSEGQPRAVDPLAMDALFDIDAPPPISLRDRFGVPPFSVLDRRAGTWQDRKRKWLSIGIRSELGRDGGATPGGGGGGFWMGKTADGRTAPGDPVKYGAKKQAGADIDGLIYNSPLGRDPDFYDKKRAVEKELGYELTLDQFRDNHYDYNGQDAYASGTSIFDPVICELVYRWFVGHGGTVLDPFAGGSVRGIAAAMLGRRYTGIDLRAEQIEANREQLGLLAADMPAPTWVTGDSLEIPTLPLGLFDLVFSCPPYADLEVYSDDPRDLSTMTYPEFEATHGTIIAAACARLRQDRFAAWVISDVRDKSVTGSPYHGLVADTVRAFEAAGLRLYNDAVILDNVGSGAMRAGKLFQQSRKLVRMHQHLLIFIKGDPREAALAAGGHL